MRAAWIVWVGEGGSERKTATNAHQTVLGSNSDSTLVVLRQVAKQTASPEIGLRLHSAVNRATAMSYALRVITEPSAQKLGNRSLRGARVHIWGSVCEKGRSGWDWLQKGA